MCITYFISHVIPKGLVLMYNKTRLANKTTKQDSNLSSTRMRERFQLIIAKKEKTATRKIYSFPELKLILILLIKI